MIKEKLPVHIRRRSHRVARIFNGDFLFKYLGNTVCGHICPGDDDRHQSDHQEGHNDLHGVLDKCHHIAHLQGAAVHGVRTCVNDQYGDAVHDQHHHRHHKGHAAVDEKVGPGQVQIGFLEALLFMLFCGEGTGDHYAGELLPGHQVQLVDQRLEHGKARHRYGEQDENQEQQKYYCEYDDPAHGAVGAEHLQNAADAQDRSVQDHTQTHHQHDLYLLDVVGAAGDQRGSGEFMEFLASEAHDLPVYIGADPVGGTRSETRCQEGDQNRAEHGDQGQSKHTGSRFHEEGSLASGQILSQLFIFTLYKGNAGLLQDAVRDLCDLVIHFLQHRPAQERGKQPEGLDRGCGSCSGSSSRIHTCFLLTLGHSAGFGLGSSVCIGVRFQGCFV